MIRSTLDLRPTLWWLADSAGAMLFAAGLAMGMASLLKHEPVSWTLILMPIGGIVRAFVFVGATNAGGKAAARMRLTLRPKLLNGLLSPSTQTRTIGADVATAIDMVEATDGYFARFQPLRTAAVVAPLLITATVAYASWVCALILLATFFPYILAMILAGTTASKVAEPHLEALTRLSGLFVDRLRALPLILAFGTEGRISRQIGAATRDAAERTLDILRIAFLSNAILEFFAALAVALVAVYCGFALLGLLPFRPPEHLSYGQALFALALAPEFYQPMRRLAAAYHDKATGEAALKALDVRILVSDATTDELQNSVPPVRIDVEELRIAPGPDLNIGPISFTLNQTGLIAIAGPTGCGKTSCLMALLGLVPIAGGRLLADGAEVPADILRPHLAWAGQKVVLMPGSIADNLTLARRDASKRDIEVAMRAAQLSQLIEHRRLSAELDDRGSGLSGGERKRIGLARALISERPILLLDEPTADLDPTASTAIRDLIIARAALQMVIVATHDEALIAQAQQVVRL